jgi:hypothetical protein
MLELLTTDAFAGWFSSLEEGPAEDVAATLDVIVQLGTRTEAPASSEWLLWYEHPLMAQRQSGAGSRPPIPEALLKFGQDWGAFKGYVSRVVKHLESASFASHLARLTSAEAAAVAAAVARIRRASASRTQASASVQRSAMAVVSGRATGADVNALVGWADLSEVREAYLAALAAAGFAVADVPAHSAALREVTLRTKGPGLRLLYGIDVARNRGLVVLGEWLDRTFYGDAVRLAEAQWRQFLGGEPVATQPASAR